MEQTQKNTGIPYVLFDVLVVKGGAKTELDRTVPSV